VTVKFATENNEVDHPESNRDPWHLLPSPRLNVGVDKTSDVPTVLEIFVMGTTKTIGHHFSYDAR
jgi:hypothetical protein